jgi:hypothetical protein
MVVQPLPSLHRTAKPEQKTNKNKKGKEWEIRKWEKESDTPLLCRFFFLLYLNKQKPTISAGRKATREKRRIYLLPSAHPQGERKAKCEMPCTEGTAKRQPSLSNA